MMAGLRFRGRARVGLCTFYSDGRYEELARRNIVEPLRSGSIQGVDRLFLYSADDLDAEFKANYKGILRHARGYGYWCWKPYVILKALGELAEGDYLCYADADLGGCHRYAGRPSRILKHFRQDIVAVSHPTHEYQYTKRDVLIALGCDSPEYTQTRQIQANFILMRKTGLVEEFVREWGLLCRDEHMITDSPSAAPNLPGFVEHRHDQSLLSLLCKKRGLEPMTFDELLMAYFGSSALRRRLALGTKWRSFKARLSGRAGNGGGGG